jgi:NAD(P)H-hydrate epimerase
MGSMSPQIRPTIATIAADESRQQLSSSLLISAAQMQQIEASLFAASMPVAALMEKVSQLVFQRLQRLFPIDRFPRVGLLIGAGHNGGDGLVIGRELHLEGRQVQVWLGSSSLKPLTADHVAYLTYLGAEFVPQVEDLADCDLLIDALFGIGLTRDLSQQWAAAVQWANQSGLPIVSIDLPSGLHSETGSPLGICIQAHTTFCLGLWKRGLWQDTALDWIGHLERIDFGIPTAALSMAESSLRLLTHCQGQALLPPHPPPATHKYRQGHLLLLCGSQSYAGAAVLTALGSRASGVGMVTVAVPQSLKTLIHQAVPEVLVRGCPETAEGSIASCSHLLQDARYSALAIGPGLGPQCQPLLLELLDHAPQIPWVLDADGLNALAEQGIGWSFNRRAATILTPHAGEFRRLFPEISLQDRMMAALSAAQRSQAILLLKGARTIIADPGGQVWVNAESTAALARGGSGDVLTGLIGGLLAQGKSGLEAACGGVWWHSQAALRVEQQRGWSGVDPAHLAEALPTLLMP